MNATEQVATKKNTRVPYTYQRYPMDLYDATGKAKKVKDEGEEDAALALGFTENPPAIPQTVAVHAMTTQPAIQSGYDALKKELEGKTVEFNVKYSALQRAYDALKAEHAALIKTLDELTAQPDDAPVDLAKAADETVINPFATIPVAEPAPKSRAALMADELKAKAKAEKAEKAKAEAK